MKLKALAIFATMILQSNFASAETCSGNVTNVMVNTKTGYVQALLTNNIGWASLCKLTANTETCKSILSLATGAQLSQQKFILEYETACSTIATDGYAAIDKYNSIGIGQ